MRGPSPRFGAPPGHRPDCPRSPGRALAQGDRSLARAFGTARGPSQIDGPRWGPSKSLSPCARPGGEVGEYWGTGFSSSTSWSARRGGDSQEPVPLRIAPGAGHPPKSLSPCEGHLPASAPPPRPSPRSSALTWARARTGGQVFGRDGGSVGGSVVAKRQRAAALHTHTSWGTGLWSERRWQAVGLV
jgi:hypothetical protein